MTTKLTTRVHWDKLRRGARAIDDGIATAERSQGKLPDDAQALLEELSEGDAMTFGSLFAGIGGMDLGLERAGMECRWQVEIDPYCQRVLAKHWPNIRRWDDVRTFPPAGDWTVDAIVGGFPCTNISNAGDREGLDGDESRLWFEFHRIICLLRPCFVLVENVAALLQRGIGRVLGDLAGSGFNAEWSCVPACALGAPHSRPRVFIVAYADSINGRQGLWNPDAQQDWTIQADDGSPRARVSWQARLANPSELYGGADGLAFGMDRNRAIGNSVAPNVAEFIGRRIMAAQPQRGE